MNILVIAPFFPPDKGVAILRISSITKYLKNKGHKVIVLTEKKDNKVPEEYLDKCYQVELKDNSTDRFGYSAFKSNQLSYIKKFNKSIKDEKIDIVLITGGPFYTFELSVYANRLGIPCVLDFRDPWAWDIRGKKDKYDPRRIIKRMIFKIFEKKAVKYATAITTVTPGWVDLYQKKYRFKKENIYLVENGYDDERLKSLNIPNTLGLGADNITIGVFGKLFYYSEYYSEIFLCALRNFMNQSKQKMLIKQIGDRENNSDNLLKSVDLPSDILFSTGVMDYESGIIELSSSDIFLIIDSRLSALGTKIYDYIYLGKPIILVAPKNSALASIVESLDNGFVCDTKEEIQETLSIIVDRYKKGLYENHEIKLNNKYSRSRNNKLMEEILLKYIN